MPEPLTIAENVELAPLTTFKVGGAARFYVDAKGEEELAGALEFAGDKGLEVFILGGGSNVLISDTGFDGLVIRMGLRGISRMELPGDADGGPVLVTAKSGEDWDDFVDWCVVNDLAGLECLSGIPGLVGGTPIQNVGAYGQEVSETIVSVRVLRRSDLEVLDVPVSECGFGYRSSIFNTTEKDRYVVLSVTYELQRDGRPKLAYPDLIEALDGSESTLRNTREAVCRIRASKGMLVRQGGADSQSAGSFFKNPVVEAEVLARVSSSVAGRGSSADEAEVPRYEAPEGLFKIPAAWLIEKAGFSKGFLKGRAGLSTVHTLAITNRGGASSGEILALKDEIQARVLEVFGIELVPEPTFIGFTRGYDSPVGHVPV